MQIRKISTSEQEEVEKYLMLDEDLLYSLIPPFLPEYEGTQFLFDGQIEAGKKKFQEIEGKLHIKICKEWELCQKIDDPALQDKIELVVVIADLISTISIYVPPFLIASILVKIGLRKFCNCSS